MVSLEVICCQTVTCWGDLVSLAAICCQTVTRWGDVVVTTVTSWGDVSNRYLLKTVTTVSLRIELAATAVHQWFSDSICT